MPQKAFMKKVFNKCALDLELNWDSQSISKVAEFDRRIEVCLAP